MHAFGTALEGDSLKTRLIYTLASGLTGRLDEFIQQNLNSSGGLERPEVEALLAVFDATMGMVYELKESAVADDGRIDAVDTLWRVYEHVSSGRLEEDGGPDAQGIVDCLYDELALELR